jgi:iron complex outermembrane receptor protein
MQSPKRTLVGFPAMHARLLVGWACLVWSLSSGTAHADTRAEAKRHFKAGMALIHEEQWAKGIAELERAYELKAHPAVQYNIGRAAERQGDLQRAMTAYRNYLASNPEDGPLVEQRLVKLESQGAAQAGQLPAWLAPASPVRSEPLPGPSLSALIAPPPLATPDALRAAAQLARSLAVALGPDAGFPPDAAAQTATGILDPSAETEASRAGSVDASVNAGRAAVPPSEGVESAEAIYAERAVTASRTDGELLDAPAAVFVMTREEIEQSGARTMPDLLRRIPGVTVVQMTQSDFNVAIRGLNRRLSNKLLVLVDGRTVYQDFLGGTAWEALPVALEDIDRIEVVKGPGAALYGASAFGGVVNIMTRQTERTGVEGVVEAGLPRQGRLGVRAEASVPLSRAPEAWRKDCKPICAVLQRVWERARVRAFATASARDAQREEVQLSRVDLLRLGDDPTTSGRSARGMASLEMAASDAHALRVEGGGVRFRQDLSSLASLRNYILDGAFSWAQARYVLGPLSLRAFYNRLAIDAGPELSARQPDPLKTRVETQLFDVEPLLDLPVRLPYIGEHRFVAGAAYRLKHVEWDYLSGEHLQHLFSGFLQESWRPLSFLSIVGSYRVDRHPLAPSYGLSLPWLGQVSGLPGLSHSARAAAILRFGQLAIRASAGTAFRDPTFMESYVNLDVPLPIDGAQFRFHGSPHLYPERIGSVETGFNVRALDRLSMDASLYALYVDRLIVTAEPVPESLGAWDAASGRYVVGRGGFTNSTTQLVGGGAEVLLRVYPVDGVDFDVGGNVHRLWNTPVAGSPWKLFSAIAKQDVPMAQARTEDPPFRLIAALRIRSPRGIEGSLDASLTGPTVWHEERLDSTSPTGVRADAVYVGPYVNTQARLGYPFLNGALVVSVVAQNLLAPVHREHPFGDRVGPRGLLTIVARP